MILENILFVIEFYWHLEQLTFRILLLHQH